MTDHEHLWKLDDAVPVLDFGKYGISTYRCTICNAIGKNDPFSNVISPVEDEG